METSDKKVVRLAIAVLAIVIAGCTRGKPVTHEEPSPGSVAICSGRLSLDAPNATGFYTTGLFNGVIVTENAVVSENLEKYWRDRLAVLKNPKVFTLNGWRAAETAEEVEVWRWDEPGLLSTGLSSGPAARERIVEVLKTVNPSVSSTPRLDRFCGVMESLSRKPAPGEQSHGRLELGNSYRVWLDAEIPGGPPAPDIKVVGPSEAKPQEQDEIATITVQQPSPLADQPGRYTIYRLTKANQQTAWLAKLEGTQQNGPLQGMQIHLSLRSDPMDQAAFRSAWFKLLISLKVAGP